MARETPVISTTVKASPTFSTVSSPRPDRALDMVSRVLCMELTLAVNTICWDWERG